MNVVDIAIVLMLVLSARCLASGAGIIAGALFSLAGLIAGICDCELN